MTENRRQMAGDMRRYSQICVAEVDKFNRDHDTDYTVEEARRSVNDILTHRSVDDYLDHLYPERIPRRTRREAQIKARENFMQLPLSERIRFQAFSEMAGALRVHAANLQELEAALEAEMEEDMGMGSFG